MPEILNVPIFLETIRVNDKYREEFTAIAPEVKADIISFKDNPKCNCRRKIHEYYEQNKARADIQSFIQKWKTQIPNLIINVTPNTQTTTTPATTVSVQAVNEAPVVNPAQAKIKPMEGHVVEIPALPAEYKTLIEHSRKDRWVYRGVSVMEKVGDDGQKTWLVFFF